MAELLGKNVRGRKKGPLRQAAAAFAADLGKGKGGKTTITLIPADGKTKADTVEVVIPKGAIVVPFALTRGKSGPNVGEQVRSGMEDAGVTDGFRLESDNIKLNDGTEDRLHYVLPS